MFLQNINIFLPECPVVRVELWLGGRSPGAVERWLGGRSPGAASPPPAAQRPRTPGSGQPHHGT